MPFWNFFAFDSRSAAKHIVGPLEQAISNNDTAGWQAVYQKLLQVHRRARVSENGGLYSNARSITSLEYYHRVPDLTQETIPQASSSSLRWLLQEFVEAIAPHYLEGTFPRPRSWILNEVAWDEVLVSDGEREELTLLCRELLDHPRKQQNDRSYSFLTSTNATNSSFMPPETVVRLAAMEQQFGLCKRLVLETGQNKELNWLARDLRSVALLIELAASRDYGIYYREDAT